MHVSYVFLDCNNGYTNAPSIMEMNLEFANTMSCNVFNSAFLSFTKSCSATVVYVVENDAENMPTYSARYVTASFNSSTNLGALNMMFFLTYLPTVLFETLSFTLAHKLMVGLSAASTPGVALANSSFTSPSCALNLDLNALKSFNSLVILS